MALLMTSVKKISVNARASLPPTEQLLVEGGDARIALDAENLNKYGCSPFPDPGILALGSSTASGISEAGFAAAGRLRGRIAEAMEMMTDAEIYAHELERIRQEFTRLCGVSDMPGLDVVFAASGTDLHLIAAQLGGAAGAPMLAIMVDPAETGSGVRAALAGNGRIDVAAVAIRLPDGTPRPIADVDAEFEALAMRAARLGQRVLLVLTDVSKTGMIAPSPACALALRQRLPHAVNVLVDACQFRIAPATLRGYLERDFMVALTGSKFVSGPPFSGALLIPAAAASHSGRRIVPRALSAYSTRADWPEHWDASALPGNVANFGLLLRWEAALAELRAFRSVPEEDVRKFLQEFAHAIHARLAGNSVFEPLPVPVLERFSPGDATGWDRIQTIFPFLLFHPATDAGRLPLSHEEVMQVYRLLQIDLSGCCDGSAIAALRCQLGQPVACGYRGGVAVSALRVCASARMVVEAAAQGGRGASAVIEKTMAALDKAALLASNLPRFVTEMRQRRKELA